MANKRVDSGPGRKSGVVKASKKAPASNRAFFLLIGGIAIAGIAALTYASTRPKDVVATNPFDTTLAAVQSAGYVMGSDTARLEVTEFGDFECPACGRFAVITEPDIRKNFIDNGKIRWRFIDYPLSGHKNTWPASRAAACADEQGKFWPFHDALYQSQDSWNGEATDNPDKFMKQLARQLGLNTSQFDQCVDTKKTQAKIQAHFTLATQRQVNQTPTFVIGDQQTAGLVPYDQFAQLLNDALAKVSKAPKSGGDTAKGGVPLPAKKKSKPGE